MRSLAFFLTVVAAVGCSESSPGSSDGSTQDGAPSDAAAPNEAGADAPACTDPCAAPNGGVVLGCEKRFWYGQNYAWKNFGTDFGGLSAWGESGVAASPNGYLADLQAMQAAGANVIRWWIFPDFRGDGLTFDSSDVPSGLGTTTLADVVKALDLADQANVFLQLTFLSFDAFRPTTTNNGVLIRSVAPIATSTSSTAALVANVVRPIVKAATSSAHADRIAAWEVINEPEWAVAAGTDPYGDQAFTPTSGLTTITFAQMETFIKAIAAGIKAETTAYVTVGGAAPKWAHAWTTSGLDLYQWHYYDWINQYWPYTDGPSKYSIGSIPVVVGELPNSGFTQPQTASYTTVMNAFFGNGYAGAMGWSYSDPLGAVSQIQSFETANACTTQYTMPGAKLVIGAKRLAPSRSRVVSRRLCTNATAGPPSCE